MAASLKTTDIRTGYRPGLVGRVVEMHARYYAGHAGFGSAFESKVAREMGEFIPRADRPANEIWSAYAAGEIVGSIAIDGEDLGDGLAHLRWFIVAEGMQGHLIGGGLIQAALVFCDAQPFRETHLWTFSGLDAARTLYERHGFVLTSEKTGSQWSKKVQEQMFVRVGPMSG